ncbi:MAG: WGR domain-containing protein, partial [Chloroflexota bacterium]
MNKNLIQEAHLGYIGGGSDKVYHIFLLKEKEGHVVNVQYGRRGGTMAAGTKTNAPVSLDEAKRIFQRTYDEKFKKGYRPIEGDTPQPMTPVTKEQTGIMPQLLNMINDAELAKVLRDLVHWMQEKMDGVRLMIEWTPERVRGINRNGEEV